MSDKEEQKEQEGLDLDLGEMFEMYVSGLCDSSCA